MQVQADIMLEIKIQLEVHLARTEVDPRVDPPESLQLAADAPLR
jgi:hypothetical protein